MYRFYYDIVCMVFKNFFFSFFCNHVWKLTTPINFYFYTCQKSTRYFIEIRYVTKKQRFRILYGSYVNTVLLCNVGPLYFWIQYKIVLFIRKIKNKMLLYINKICFIEKCNQYNICKHINVCVKILRTDYVENMKYNIIQYKLKNKNNK